MSQAADGRKKKVGSSGNLDAYAEIFKARPHANDNAAAHEQEYHGDAVPAVSARQPGSSSSAYATGLDRLTLFQGTNAGQRTKYGMGNADRVGGDALKQQQQQGETLCFETTFRSRGSSVTTVVEGLPPQKRSGELPRGSSSSSSSDNPMFDMPRPSRKSGEVGRASVSSGTSFSGEIPRAATSSADSTSQKRSGEMNRVSHSSSGSCSNGDSPTLEAIRGRKSGEMYPAGNSSGGSSSGGSPTPEIFNNRGRNAAHAGSNSSAGSSDGGNSPTSDMWNGKPAVLSGAMVTGGSFSSFSTVANGTGDANGAKKLVKEASTTGSISAATSVTVQNGGSHATRFVVGTTTVAPARTSSAPANRVSLSGGLASKAGPPRSSSDQAQRTSLTAEDVKAAGNVEYKKGNLAQALALYDRAIALCPDQAAYRCNRAAALAGLGRLTEAIKESETAIRLDPAFTRAHQRLASLYLRLGQVDEAKKHLKAAGQQNNSSEAVRAGTIEKKLANCSQARMSRDWSALVRECDAAVVAGADSSVEVYVMKAEALLRLQRLDEADAVLLAARRVEDASPRSTKKDMCNTLLLLRAQVDMAQGRFEEAVAVAERAARLEPRNVEISSLLRKSRTVAKSRTAGNDFFKAGKYFESCAAYTEGLELDPANAVLLCNRAASRSKLGQWEKALEDCNAALRVQPNYMKALLRRAHSFAKLERWEDAVRDYEAIRREHPGDVEVARALFDVQVSLKRSRGEEICKTRFGGVEEVSRNDQFREAVSCPGLSVVEFTTRWSDRCRQFSGFVDELCRQYPSVNFAKVDVDDSPYLAQMERINSVPTIKIFRNGVKVRELLGPSQQGLEQAVKQCGV